MRWTTECGIFLSTFIFFRILLSLIRTGLLLYDNGKDQGPGRSMMVCAFLIAGISFNVFLAMKVVNAAFQRFQSSRSRRIHRKKYTCDGVVAGGTPPVVVSQQDQRNNLRSVSTTLGVLLSCGVPTIFVWNLVTYRFCVPMIPLFRIPYPYALPRWIMMLAIGPFWIVGNMLLLFLGWSIHDEWTELRFIRSTSTPRNDGRPRRQRACPDFSEGGTSAIVLLSA